MGQQLLPHPVLRYLKIKLYKTNRKGGISHEKNKTGSISTAIFSVFGVYYNKYGRQ